MTDVAPKTPNKRKSFDGKQGSAKKAKVGNGPTPQQFGSAKKQQSPKPQKNQTPKQNNQQTPKSQKNQHPKQNNQQTPKQNNQQTPKKNNQQTPKPNNQQTPKPNNQQTPKQVNNNQENAVNKSNKKNKKGDKPNVTPFKGTSLIKIDTPVSVKTGKDQIKSESKVAPLKKEKTGTNESNNTDGQKIKKRRNNQYHVFKEKIRSEDTTVKSAAIADLANKIKEIESRGQLTKTAIRKLKLLKKYKRVAEGVHQPDPPAKNPHPKSESTKRRDRRNKAQKDKAAVKPVPQIKKEVKKVVKEEEDSDESEEEVKYAALLQQKKGVVKEEAESEDSDDSDEDEDEASPVGAAQDADSDDSEDEDDSGGDEEESDEEDNDDDSEEESD